MSFTEIVSNMDLTIYPIIAMVLFLAAFAVIAWRVVVCPKSVSHHQAMIVLDEGPTKEMLDLNAEGDTNG
jgi:hypothetical protein